MLRYRRLLAEVLRLEAPCWFQPRAQDLTCHANPGWIFLVSPGISEESTCCPLFLALDAIDPDEAAAIRLNLRQHALGNDRFRGAIERQLGRCVGPAALMGRRPKVRLTGKESSLWPLLSFLSGC